MSEEFTVNFQKSQELLHDLSQRISVFIDGQSGPLEFVPGVMLALQVLVAKTLFGTPDPEEGLELFCRQVRDDWVRLDKEFPEVHAQRGGFH